MTGLDTLQTDLSKENYLRLSKGTEGQEFLSVVTYRGSKYSFLPFYIINSDKWQLMECNYLKNGKGWFAKTIGEVRLYKRK